MALYTKDSLETLRQRVNIVELLSSYVDLKPAGATYKALCPFHDEKTPSFVVQKGGGHYHCFGCGAHGDAIQFLMNHEHMSFSDAVEALAERFHVTLERVEGFVQRGPDKKRLKEACLAACRFFQCMLWHTQEGHAALRYLYSRGLDEDFLRRFAVGLAPKETHLFLKTLQEEGFSREVLVQAGLAVERSEGGGLREFFYDRITFPICDATGAVIAFSARKYKEDTFGGKYVNTAETPLFKKSRVLFGLHHGRKRILKDKKAIVVEGQIDCLRMIQEGYENTVAGQGTAFGEGHVQELVNLGIEEAVLSLDGDGAGREATVKIGQLFQKVGCGVKVVALPDGVDPDAFLRDRGREALQEKIHEAQDYLTFLVAYYSQEYDMATPAGKNALVAKVVKHIREWNSEVMVLEGLKKLAKLADVPEDALGVSKMRMPSIYLQTQDRLGDVDVNAARVLEVDLLRWLVLAGPSYPAFFHIARENLQAEHFFDKDCQKAFSVAVAGQCGDPMTLAAEVDDESLFQEIYGRKVNIERAEALFVETVQRLLDRKWMNDCESIRAQIASGQLDDDTALRLAQDFQQLRGKAPKVVMTSSSG